MPLCEESIGELTNHVRGLDVEVLKIRVEAPHRQGDIGEYSAASASGISPFAAEVPPVRQVPLLLDSPAYYNCRQHHPPTKDTWPTQGEEQTVKETQKVESGILKSPSKRNRSGDSNKIALDDFDFDVLKRTVHEVYTVDKEVPTMNTLVQKMP
ncbi:hypothetical protein FQR65_LT11921 [Abscondita terminalis]|nr:hypothetical protein FQR65_LT11921 [Abscondita terminalis]